MLPILGETTPFPPVSRALRNPNGLLAVGGALTPARLLDAYRQGIFPWSGPGEPMLWWSPNPRMVLRVADFHVSASLARRVRSGRFETRLNTAFRAVMEACAAPRPGQDGTWITPEVIDGYCALHAAGYAHSVESWLEGALVGGLYGVLIGRMFFGESMFARATDASKVALVRLVEALRAADVPLIDCQQETRHLASFGARPIPRGEFIRTLRPLVAAGQAVFGASA
ncbi:MAG: leucyl/phenylalanyl-tRNA--protein transferase [Thermoflexales bacterium]|nr:leucyl/phenylalanyl-tRNA--protein transferase [Thermoflexales bacterium]